MAGVWERFRAWRRSRVVREYEEGTAEARHAAEERISEARTQARRPQGSGRPTTYDEGHTGERF